MVQREDLRQQEARQHSAELAADDEALDVVGLAEELWQREQGEEKRQGSGTGTRATQHNTTTHLVQLVGAGVDLAPALRVPVLRLYDADHEALEEEQHSQIDKHDAKRPSGADIEDCGGGEEKRRTELGSQYTAQQHTATANAP